jgi:predicted amidohydrolase
MPDLKISLIQSDLSWEDPAKNLDHFSQIVDAMHEPVDLVLLPEMFSTGFSIQPDHCAEEMNGPSMKFLTNYSGKLNSIIAGSLKIKDDGKNYNRLIWMNPDGTFIQYDKRHLFKLSDESTIFTEGEKKQVIHHGSWKILPLICYDLRFPVWSKNTWSEKGYEYDLLVYVANWPESRANVWRSLLVARAIENQAFVAGVNRIGKDGAGTNHAGGSLIVDPKGRIIAEAPAHEPAILTASLPFAELRSFRESFQIGRDWDQFTIEM